MWKWISVALLACLLLSNAFWLYLALDWASGEKYRQNNVYVRENQIDALRDLVEHFVEGSTKTALNETLVHVFPDFEPFEKEGAINTLWLSFPISSEGLIEGVEVHP